MVMVNPTVNRLVISLTDCYQTQRLAVEKVSEMRILEEY